MTITKDFASKLSVALVAIAMVFALVAPAAQAQTEAELQQMINDLLAQVSSLQSQLGQSGQSTGMGASDVCPYTWTRDLSQGSTGNDVLLLQQFLNADPDTRVAATGVGSAGQETQYYGALTAAAVSKFQVKYRSEILSPLGLVNPTGYFGAGSRAKANDLCVTPPTPTPDEDEDEDEMDEDEDEEDEDEEFELSGEAALDNFELDDGESTIEEGDEDVVIGEITVEFTDGDAEISRIDVTLDHDTSNSAEPWEAFDTLSLWVDGDKVAEIDASDEDEYLDEDIGEIRFTNLGIIGEEDEEMEILVAASIQNNVDSTELGDWTLEVSSMRFFDADGVATTESDPAGTDEANFEIQEAGSDEELNISLASNNPDSTDIIVDNDVDTDDVTVLIADLEADDNDIEIDTIVVRVTTGTTTSKVVDDVRISLGGETIDAESVGTENDGDAAADGTGTGLSEGRSERLTATTTLYYFDVDGDVVIDDGDEIEMEVLIDFNDTDDGNRYPNGTTIKASITSSETAWWDAEGADDLDPSTQIDGSAVGDTHTLVAEGILVPVDGFDSSVITLGQDDTIGEFTLEFEVTAVEDDFFITNAAATTTSNPTQGVGFTVSGGSVTSVTASLTSTADEDTSDVFTVREGETETFTLVVTVDAAAAGTYRVALNEVHYTSNADGVTGTTQYDVTPASDFRTAPKSINQ